MSWQDNLKKLAESNGEKLLLKKAQEIKEQAKINAPKKSGDLANSIEIVPVNKLKVKIGSNLPYAIYQELGTRKIAPVAYLRRALRRIIK